MNRYETIKTLGDGTYGSVYLAKNKESGFSTFFAKSAKFGHFDTQILKSPKLPDSSKIV